MAVYNAVGLLQVSFLNGVTVTLKSSVDRKPLCLSQTFVDQHIVESLGLSHFFITVYVVTRSLLI